MGLIRESKEMVAEVVKYHELLWTLTWRDIAVRYKQSIIGVGWALLVPLATMIIFTFIFTRAVKIKEILDIDMPYPIFAYIGLLPWTFFARSLGHCSESLVSNVSLVTKIYFPREVFPFAKILGNLFDFAIASLVLVGLLAYYNFFTDWHFQFHWTILYLPIILGVQILFMAGLGFFFSVGTLFYRDVRYLTPVLVQLWFFCTNVVYPIPTTDPVVRAVVYANPMAPIISGYRECLIYGQTPFTAAFGYAAGISILLFVVGWWVFHRLEFKFAENI